MTGTLVGAVSALALTNLAFGWYLGYHAPASYLTFWALCWLIAGAAVRLERIAGAARGAADRILRIGVIAFALVTLGCILLGFTGTITPIALTAFAALAFAAAWWSARDRPPRSPFDPQIPWLVFATLVALLAFVVGFGALQSPLTLYDSLSYHLYFPARWLLAHRITIVPTSFSDPAQAYQPGDGELFFLWLMAPFHGDLVARVGQLPFLLLGAVAIYALAMRLGAPRANAGVAVLLYLCARPVVEQAVGADVDLISSAMLLTSIYFGIAAVGRDNVADWLLWGVSLGLFWGSKYLALAYSPVVLVFPFIRGIRRRALWAIPGIAAFAMPWYLRNWVVAGSPIYPSSVQVAGLVIARGAFTRAAMNNTVFHTRDLRLLLPITAHAFGVPLFVVWVPLALVGAFWLLRRRPLWPSVYVVLTPLAMVALFWLVLPVNVDSRFLLGAVAVAAVPTAFAFGTGRSSTVWLGAVGIAALAWLAIGAHTDVPASLPWYMGGWLTLDGIVDRSYLWMYAALVVAGAAAWMSTARVPQYRPAVLAALVGAAAFGLGRGSDVWCPDRRCDLLDVSSIYIRPTMLYGWYFVRTQIRGATIAYTGNNVPYPLFGEQLTNRVYYVSIDRHLDWALHDYARVRRRVPVSAAAQAMARPSGELMPISDRATYEDACRPRYERAEGFRDAWLANLRALAIDHLFVSALSAYDIDNVWHDEHGFPIEDAWARQDPRTFSRVYENDTVRIYTVAP